MLLHVPSLSMRFLMPVNFLSVFVLPSHSNVISFLRSISAAPNPHGWIVVPKSGQSDPLAFIVQSWHLALHAIISPSAAAETVVPSRCIVQCVNDFDSRRGTGLDYDLSDPITLVNSVRLCPEIV